MGMVALKCPACGADIELDDNREFGFCHYCGTKVVMQEKVVVEHKGSVSIDTSDELNNLYTLARRAKNNYDSANAQKFYEQILLKDPMSWEANFYSVYYQSSNCVIANISSAAYSVLNNLEATFTLIKSNVSSFTEQRAIINELVLKVTDLSTSLCIAAKNHYNKYNQATNSFGEYCQRRDATIKLDYYCGDLIIEMFGDDFADLATIAWTSGIAKKGNKNQIKQYTEKIRQVDPSFEGLKPKENKFVKYGLPFIIWLVFGVIVTRFSNAVQDSSSFVKAIPIILSRLSLIALIAYYIITAVKKKKAKRQ